MFDFVCVILCWCFLCFGRKIIWTRGHVDYFIRRIVLKKVISWQKDGGESGKQL
jgi:hypothetical protein